MAFKTTQQTICSAPSTTARNVIKGCVAINGLRLDQTRNGDGPATKLIYRDLVASSPQMQAVLAIVQRLAPTSASALITGESGTGKEVVARAIHQYSARRNGPFVAVNCAAMPDGLIESELFGHERGAFTGAFERHPGCFELAAGGTLMLDEIGEMPPLAQVKLLRVLEDHRVRRLGGTREIDIDVRVLAATNKQPAIAMQTGALREDLYYRLNVFHIALPPLRERKMDVAPLACAWLPVLNSKHGCAVTGIDAEALGRLEEYSWPGNIRELRNVLERAIIVATSGQIGSQHLLVGSTLQALPIDNNPNLQEGPDWIRVKVGTTLVEAERQLILKTLCWTGFNRSRAAKILGTCEKTVCNKMR